MFGSIEIDCVLGESCYKGTILQGNFNSFVKFHSEFFFLMHMTVLHQNFTTLTNFGTKYLVLCKVDTDVGGIK